MGRDKNTSLRRRMQQILSVSKTAYFNWVVNPRILIIPLTWLFFYKLSIEPMLGYTEIMNTPLNLFEPFILITNSSYVVALIPLFFLMLVSDCPKLGSGDIFIIFRTGKLSWLFGQTLFFVYAAVTYVGSLFLFCSVVALSRSYIADGWSEVTMFIRNRADFDYLYIENPASVIEPNLYMHSRPYATCIRSFVLITLYLLVIGGIMLLFNILKHKKIGMIVSFSIVILGFITWAQLGDAMWLFPMANSIYGWHNQSILAEKVYPIANSYFYFFVMLTLLSLLSCIAIKRSAIHASCNES